MSNYIKYKNRELENWPFSRYELPAMKLMLEDQLKILKNLNLRNKTKSRVCIFGSMPHGEFRPRLEELTPGGYAILFNYGVPIFIYNMAKAICVMMPNNGDLPSMMQKINPISDYEYRFSELYNRTQELIEAYINYIDPSKSMAYLQEKEYAPFISTYTRISETFLFLHEYAHFEHSDGIKKRNANKYLKNWPKTLSAYSKFLEYRADAYAFKYIFNELKSEYKSTIEIYLPIEFTLHISNILQNIKGNYKNKTHPTFSNRILILRRLLRNKVDKSEYVRIIRICEYQKTVFEILLKYLKI